MDKRPSMHFERIGRSVSEADERYLQALADMAERAYSLGLAQICEDLYATEHLRLWASGSPAETPRKGN